MSESNGNGKPKGHPSHKTCNVCARMMKKLQDFREHWREELHQCLFDTMGPIDNITPHLVGIRKHLDLEGKVCLVTHKYGRGETTYQLVPLSAVIPALG